MQTKLRDDGYRITDDENAARVISPSGPPRSHGGFFRKKSTSTEWKMPEVKALANGEVGTGVEIKDICLRVENEMGLYETRTGKAVVVRVDAGA